MGPLNHTLAVNERLNLCVYELIERRQHPIGKYRAREPVHVARPVSRRRLCDSIRKSCTRLSIAQVRKQRIAERVVVVDGIISERNVFSDEARDKVAISDPGIPYRGEPW